MKDIPRDIIIRASRGDIAAFEEIYKTACSFVYSLALRVTRNSSEAEDVVQEVFMKVHRNLSRFKFRSAFKTWVYRVAVNTAINTYRKTSKEMGRRVDFDKVARIYPAASTVQSGMEKEENREKFSVLLTVLNPDQRVCILLREVEGLSYKEIAAVLKININTVRSRLKRARSLLLSRQKSEVVKSGL